QVLEEKIKVAIHPEYPEKTIAIGSTLTEKGRKELCALLRQNLDVFAWKPADMTGVPRHIAEHRLNIREGCLPIRQKKRGQAPERNKAIQEEVEKLVDARIMKEVHYHSWLSNPEGMFLGYKVNADGLKVCPDKADAVLSLPSLGCLKDKCTKKSDFQWTQEAEVAFRQMKKLIAELPMLTAPKEREELIMYLAAAKEAISAVLMTEREGKQMPVYFVSRALRGPEINYTPMEKLVLALLSASRRLKRYFQAHTIVVITDQPIKQLLSNSEITRRMLKWKFELEGYDIQYRPRISIKGQILADFIVERPEEESPDKLMAEPEELPEPWTLFTDGSSCIDGSGAGLILTNPEGVEFTYAMRFRFEATNNEAEYEALIVGLRIEEQMGVKNLQTNVDSRLVSNQVNGSYVAKESVPRSKNKKADALSKIASTSFAHLSKQVLVEELNEKSINEKEVLAIVEEEGHTWMTPICEYLTKEILLKDKKKARAVRLYTRNLSWDHGSGMSDHFKQTTSLEKYTKDPAACTLVLDPCPSPHSKKSATEINPYRISVAILQMGDRHTKGPGKVKFLIVAIDYFTKWIEAKPVSTITDTVEAQLVTYRKNEVLFSEEVAVLKREAGCKQYEINMLKTEFEKVKQEKEDIDFKIEKFENASKDLDKLLGSQITDNGKMGLGYHAVPPPHPLIYNALTKLDLSYSGLDEFKEPEFEGYGLRAGSPNSIRIKYY
ncbi:reverse transcriptase domain-containing protein, partial [Tanacetum coccineum]